MFKIFLYIYLSQNVYTKLLREEIQLIQISLSPDEIGSSVTLVRLLATVRMK